MYDKSFGKLICRGFSGRLLRLLPSGASGRSGHAGSGCDVNGFWGDFRLVVFAQSALFALLFTSCVFAELPLFATLSIQARSVPLLAALASAFLMSYLHAFQLRRRAAELAVYDILGMSSLRRAAIYSGEQFLAGLLCLAAGLLFSIPLVWLMLVLLREATGAAVPVLFDLETLRKALGETLTYFGGIFIVSLLAQTRKLISGSAISRLALGRRNETPLSRAQCRRRLAFSLSCFLAAAAMLGWLALDMSAAPLLVCSVLLAPALLAAIFSFYSGAYSLLRLSRAEHPSRLYRGLRLPSAGNSLSQCRGNAHLSGATCVCFLVAMVSFLSGVLLLGESCPPDQLIMGSAQIFLCILFLTAAMVLLAVRSRAEIREYAGQLPVLSRLGMEQKQLARFLWRGVVLRFGAPLAGLLPLVAVGVPLLSVRLQAGTLWAGLLLFFGILAVLFLLYAPAAWERVAEAGGASHAC